MATLPRPVSLVHSITSTPATRNTVMIVDDQSTGRVILAEIVRGMDQYVDAVTFEDPEAALNYARSHSVDMVITDYLMPNMNGIDLVRELRKVFHDDTIPIVVITVDKQPEVRYQALNSGAIDFLTRPIDRIEYRQRFTNLLALRRRDIENANRRKWLEDKVRIATQELRRREVDILFRLSRAAESRDKVTGLHLQRMAKYAALLAGSHGLSAAQQEAIELAAPMHDLGKIAVPDRILQSSRNLSQQDMQVMKNHTVIGYEFLKDSKSEYLQMGAMIALGHHEKYDGSGYPNGLKGEAIPLESRIVALADVYDALTSIRPYKQAWQPDQAFAWMREQSGRHFDPDLLEVLLRSRPGILAIAAQYADDVVRSTAVAP
jgi:two-component system, response regulator RpfG